MTPQEMEALNGSIDAMMDIATRSGLDYFPMRFEVCPPEILYTFGAYGMPTRYSHWSFGKSYHRLKLDYDLGLSRIYELVINSNPCYAFLLDGNSLLQNKVVSAHVLAHCDFFKNNATFTRTSRDMVERMAGNAQRIHQYELEHGRDRVEQLLDAGMALQEHVDVSRYGEAMRRTAAENQGYGRFKNAMGGAGAHSEAVKEQAVLGRLRSATGWDAVPGGLSEDLPYPPGEVHSNTGRGKSSAGAGHGLWRKSGGYDDLWGLDKRLHEEGSGAAGPTGIGNGVAGNAPVATGTNGQASAVGGGITSTAGLGKARIPEFPQKDLMMFLIEHGRALEEWERDVLSLLREEMLYFWPQLETKVMNEGWATYWHLRIMREMELTDAEALEFAKMHSGVVLPSKFNVNPYHLGLAIWEDIERRWDHPTLEERDRYGREPGQGREKIFEVRETESDISFLRNYLTKELVQKLDLFLYQKVGNEWRVVETDWEKVRDEICTSRVNGGIPVLYVQDGDYNQNGELYLHHAYEGVELDVKYLEKTLPYVYQLWGRPCHLQTVIEGREVLFTHDGKRTQRKFL